MRERINYICHYARYYLYGHFFENDYAGDIRRWFNSLGNGKYGLLLAITYLVILLMSILTIYICTL